MNGTTPEEFFIDLLDLPEDFFDSVDFSDPSKLEEPGLFADKVRDLVPQYLTKHGYSIDRCGKDPTYSFAFDEDTNRYVLRFRSRAPRTPIEAGFDILFPGDWDTSAKEYARRVAEAIAERLEIHDELCSDLDCSGQTEKDRQEYVRRRSKREVNQSDTEMDDLSEPMKAFFMNPID